MFLLGVKLLAVQVLIALLSCSATQPVDTTPPEVPPEVSPEVSLEMPLEMSRETPVKTLAKAPAETPLQSRPQNQPQTQADAKAATDPVIELLDKLEKSTKDLRDFQATIRYAMWDAALEQQQLRTGKLIYQANPDDDSKRFAIFFDTLVVGRRKQEHKKHYIFADGWLVEIDHENKQFIKRQIVAPGKKYDPLKLGEGPFPLPIGQSKDEVLARFDVKLLDKPSDEFLAGRLKDLDVKGMVLVPKPNTPEAEKFLRVELFYDSKLLLPIAINAVAAEAVDPDDPNSHNRKTVWLINVKRNQGIDESKLSIAEPDKTEWEIDVRQWEGD